MFILLVVWLSLFISTGHYLCTKDILEILFCLCIIYTFGPAAESSIRNFLYIRLWENLRNLFNWQKLLKFMARQDMRIFYICNSKLWTKKLQYSLIIEDSYNMKPVTNYKEMPKIQVRVVKKKKFLKLNNQKLVFQTSFLIFFYRFS